MFKYKKFEIDGIGVDVKQMKSSSFRTEAQKAKGFKSKGKGVKRQAKVKKTSNISNITFSDNRQFCTVITKFKKTKVEHFKNLEYIQKEGKSLDGDKPKLYGSDSEEKYIENMDELSWRIILSPDSNKIDLSYFAKTFIKKLESETGYQFNWIAANHYDTRKHHTHIIINGIDKNGKQVRFLPKEYIKNMMREHARNICTSMIGKRTLDDIEEKKVEAINKNYFTMLDKKLQNYITNNNLTKIYLRDKDEHLLNKRIDYLIELGLCKYDKSTQITTFSNNWIEILKTLGKYNTFLDGFNYAKCSRDKYTLHNIKQDGIIEGEILKKYTMQKDSNNFALVLKKDDGSVSYVPLNFYPKNCFVGDKIRIEHKGEFNTNIQNFSKK